MVLQLVKAISQPLELLNQMPNQMTMLNDLLQPKPFPEQMLNLLNVRQNLMTQIVSNHFVPIQGPMRQPQIGDVLRTLAGSSLNITAG